jgi:hypothetical protein
MKFASILALSCLVLGWTGPRALAAPAERTLPASHLKAKVTCFDCHQEEVPTARPVAAATCMGCHGDLPAMAFDTRKLPVNPHAPPAPPHPGPFACTECHRQHQAPVVKCLECHPKFKFTAK